MKSSETKLSRLSAALLFMLMCLTAVTAQEPDRQAFDTLAGKLEIVRTGDESEPTDEIRLNGKMIFKADPLYSLSVHTHFLSLDGVAEAFLIFEASGGNGCPGEFFLLTIASSKKATISEGFGDCSDTPTVTQKPDSLTFTFPGFYTNAAASEPGFRPPPPSTWIYKGGVLKQVKLQPTRRKK